MSPNQQLTGLNTYLENRKQTLHHNENFIDHISLNYGHGSLLINSATGKTSTGLQSMTETMSAVVDTTNEVTASLHS